MASTLSSKKPPAASEALLGPILAQLARSQPGLARGWFSRLQQVDFDAGVLRVHTQNEAQAAHLRIECLTALMASAQDLTGRFVSFEFLIAPQATAESSDVATREPGLAEFVAGPGNRLARAAVIAATESPGATYNPLFLHGASGTGKTHLLRAAAWALRDRPDAPVFHFTGDSWTADLVEHFERDTLETWQRRVRGGGALILDDVHTLADRPRSLDELFHTINVFLDGQRQIILAADRPPTELSGFPPRLIGRFSAGLVAGIDPQDTETRAAILHAKARSTAIEVSDEVVKMLAADGPDSLHELSGILVRLDAMSRMEAMPISIEMARRAVSGG